MNNTKEDHWTTERAVKAIFCWAILLLIAWAGWLGIQGVNRKMGLERDIGTGEGRQFLEANGYTVLDSLGDGFVCHYDKTSGDRFGPGFSVALGDQNFTVMVCEVGERIRENNEKDPLGKRGARWIDMKFHLVAIKFK